MPTLLILDNALRARLRELYALAEAHPVDMLALQRNIKTEFGKAFHMLNMTRQTITIPLGFMVTFSIETGHPCGTARHMSMSVSHEGRVPHPEAVWMVAQELGFTGTILDCVIWTEPLQGHGVAINLSQEFDRASLPSTVRPNQTCDS